MVAGAVSFVEASFLPIPLPGYAIGWSLYDTADARLPALLDLTGSSPEAPRSRRAERIVPPIRPNPRISSAQVAGSGTAPTGSAAPDTRKVAGLYVVTVPWVPF